MPNFIAFCATAPGVRRNFLAVAGPDSFDFANARRFFTSSLDQAFITRRFAFAIKIPSPNKGAKHNTVNAKLQRTLPRYQSARRRSRQ